MGRLRLELVLVVVLVAALLGAVLFRGGPPPMERDGDDASRPDPLAGATPCFAAAVGHSVRGPSAAEADVARVAPVVEEIRELTFERPPEPIYLPRPRFENRVREMTGDLDEELAQQQRLLAALGALPEGLDLGDEVEDLLGEQVAGFYDPEDDELVVSASARTGLSTTELLVLVHELQHALADQRLGIPDLEALNQEDADAATAAQALLEGDAQITTEAYAARALTIEDRLGAVGEQVPGLGDVPHYLARSLVFPYIEGARFACGLFETGGWPAVDAAYEELPRSTAEILFPERYRSGDEPVDPPDPRGLPAPWTEGETLTVGAADLLFLFEAPGDDPSRALTAPLEHVRSWTGGEVHVWTRGPRTAVGLVLAADDGEALCGSIRTWHRRANPDADDATAQVPGAALALDDADLDGVLYCEGSSVRLGVGPELAVARAVVR